jgi:hypothetical protein
MHYTIVGCLRGMLRDPFPGPRLTGRAGATDSNGGTGKQAPKMQDDTGTSK